MRKHEDWLAKTAWAFWCQDASRSALLAFLLAIKKDPGWEVERRLAVWGKKYQRSHIRSLLPVVCAAGPYEVSYPGTCGSCEHG